MPSQIRNSVLFCPIRSESEVSRFRRLARWSFCLALAGRPKPMSSFFAKLANSLAIRGRRGRELGGGWWSIDRVTIRMLARASKRDHLRPPRRIRLKDLPQNVQRNQLEAAPLGVSCIADAQIQAVLVRPDHEASPKTFDEIETGAHRRGLRKRAATTEPMPQSSCGFRARSSTRG
jgi:hypothetical protein